ncbi:MAG: class II fructose-bisphosphate aldolase [Patescibacteria group bacterium]|nr:class II fructose-bisphosphate aldolase [Patescibacteria group bacterium]
MLVHLKQILKKAEKENYALGCFATHNLETTLGVALAAKAKSSPIIIGVSARSIRYAGLKPITHLVKTIAQNVVPSIPVVLHLDHGETFHSAVECIQSGFSSIMIDASELPFDENVALTKKVVEYAHRYGVLVQGEIGRVPKTISDIRRFQYHREEFLTDPNEAYQFVKKTKVDTLAVGIGNVHGVWKMEHPIKLDFPRLKEISAKVKIPLVLHGASGLEKREIKKAISLGIRIINIHTEINIAFSTALKEFLKKEKKEIDPRKILSHSIEAVKRLVEKKIEIFSSLGKA